MKPHLRFKEFTDEWQVKKLGSLLDSIESGVSPSTLKLNNEQGVPFLKVEDLNNSVKYQTHSRNYVGDISDKMTIHRKSIIFPKRGAAIMTNKVRINTVDVLMDTNLMAITPNSTLLNNDFLYLKILDDGLYKIADTSTIPQINNKHIIPYKIAIPQLAEQKKIAGFLTVVDERVELAEKRVALLKKYKKGMMQKIFTQKIRFKDENGKPYPDWQEKTLIEISDRITKKNKDNAINFVLTNSATEGIVSQIDYFEKDIANKSNLTNYFIISVDDFVYNPRISVHAPVGPIKRNHLREGVMSPLYTIFHINRGNKDFYEKYFDTSYWHNYLKTVANSGARHDRMNITTIDFYNMLIPYPCDTEQQKIAAFLTAIDDKIKIEEAKLEQSKRFKKSLLQRIFV